MKSEFPQKVVVLGSSARKIGEAGEFDYSGSQAIKARQEAGIRGVRGNRKIATMQTAEPQADPGYCRPGSPAFVGGTCLA